MSLLEQEVRPKRHERLLVVVELLAALALVGCAVNVADPAARQGLTDQESQCPMDNVLLDT